MDPHIVNPRGPNPRSLKPRAQTIPTPSINPARPCTEIIEYTPNNEQSVSDFASSCDSKTNCLRSVMSVRGYTKNNQLDSILH